MKDEIRRSEILAAYWRERFVRGEIELDEMEAGIGRALSGEATDREWVEACRHEEVRRLFTEPIRNQPSLATVDSLLKSLYLGPVRS